ncbi:hypothetical protein Tco_0494341 [Tanacetum coccineum]
MTSKAQQIELDNALVAPENRHVIIKCNMRINPGMKPKEPTYQRYSQHMSKDPGQEFDEPPTEEEALSFIRELGHSREIKYITDVIVDHLHQPWRTFASIINKCLCGKDLAYQIDNIDSKKQDKMFYPRFTKIIIHHFFEKYKSISLRNRTFMHTAHDDSLLGTMRFVSRHANTQVYGAILPKSMANQDMLDSISYKTYFAITSGAEPPKSRKSLKKSDSAISSEESPSNKKSAKAKKVAATKPKPTKKKEPVKADRGKGLNVISEVALSEVAQPKEATKGSKKDFHVSQASGSGNGTDLESGVPDEQHHKTPGTDEGTKEDDDDEDVTEDDESNDDNDGDDDDDNDANDDDNQEDDDKNDDEKDTNSDRTESIRIKKPVLNHSATEYYEKEEEKVDDEEKMDEEDDEVTKELYKDLNVNLGNEDIDMTDADQGGLGQQNISQDSGFEQVEEDAHVTLTPVFDTQKTDELVQSSSVSSDFTSKLLNLENPSLADNEIASLMDTIVRHEEPGSLSKIKQVDQYAQALSTIPAIVDRYIDNKLREAIQKAILAHNLDCREEAQAKKRDYIELVDTSMRAILKEEKNVTESLEAAVLARSSSQPKSTYEVAASLFEFELTKILIDKMEKNKLYDKADYKRELYDALVKSYQTDKYLFDTYGEVFTLKRSRDDKDKDQDPSDGSDRGMKSKKSSKEVESSRDSRSKEKKYLSTSKDASHSQHKPSGKSAHAEEPSVERYQKKLNLTKTDTFRSNLRNRTTYTAYLDPKGVIYKDQNKRNRLMHADELHKFSDGTLNDIRTALHDIAKGIRMEYLPKRKWSGLDKRRARVMIQDIEKQLFQRRLTRNLKKFIGGREYGNNLRLLEWTI